MVEAKGLRYMGMGVSGGEEGARNGERRAQPRARGPGRRGRPCSIAAAAARARPSRAPPPSAGARPPPTRNCRSCSRPPGPALMPGGTPEAYKYIEPIVQKVAAQVRERGERAARRAGRGAQGGVWAGAACRGPRGGQRAGLVGSIAPHSALLLCARPQIIEITHGVP